MLTCAICGRALRECCDLFHEAVDENGNTVIVCNECAIANNLQFEPDDDDDEEEKKQDS